MADTLEMWGKEWTNVTGFKANNDQHTQLTFYRPQGTKSITENGTGIDVAAYANVNVNVASQAPSLQSKNATPTETAQTITADNGYDGLSQVNVGAISSTYVGSGIARKSSTDLTVNGATVTAPSGYYSSAATKSVASGSASTPATTITANPTISVSSGGLITATASATKSVTPTVSAGYVSSGTAGTITVSGSNTQQLDTIDFPTSASSSAMSGYTSKATISRSTSDQYINIGAGYNTNGAYYKINATPNGTVTAPSTISGTSATVSTGTNTLTLSKTISVIPNVTTAGYISGGTVGNASVSLTASVTTKGAATYNTSSTDQTISANQYLTGAQTIKAVTTSNISAANIKAGVTVTVGDSNDADRIAGVTGTFTSDGTATASDIVSGKSAYVNGSKVDGSLTFSTITVSSSNPTGGSNGDIWIKTS